MSPQSLFFTLSTSFQVSAVSLTPRTDVKLLFVCSKLFSKTQILGKASVIVLFCSFANSQTRFLTFCYSMRHPFQLLSTLSQIYKKRNSKELVENPSDSRLIQTSDLYHFVNFLCSKVIWLCDF